MTITAYPKDRAYDYVVASDPNATINPIRPNALWLNSVTGQLWTCTSNAINANTWVNQSGFGIIDSDPYWDKVEFLFSPEGVNGSIDFQDYSTVSKKAITVSGNCVMQKDYRFGRSFVYFDGTDDRLQASSSRFALGSSDFTIEFWVHAHNGGTAYSRILEIGTVSTAGVLAIMRSNLAWPYSLQVETYTTGYAAVIVQATTFKNYSWNHFAVQRTQGQYWTIWVNGVLDASATSISGGNLTGTTLNIGGSSSLTFDYTGLIGDIRITKAARYTSTFTPPAYFQRTF